MHHSGAGSSLQDGRLLHLPSLRTASSMVTTGCRQCSVSKGRDDHRLPVSFDRLCASSVAFVTTPSTLTAVMQERAVIR